MSKDVIHFFPVCFAFWKDYCAHEKAYPIIQPKVSIFFICTFFSLFVTKDQMLQEVFCPIQAWNIIESSCKLDLRPLGYPLKWPVPVLWITVMLQSVCKMTENCKLKFYICRKYHAFDILGPVYQTGFAFFYGNGMPFEHTS